MAERRQPNNQEDIVNRINNKNREIDEITILPSSAKLNRRFLTPRGLEFDTSTLSFCHS
jgi:hypothetical protein